MRHDTRDDETALQQSDIAHVAAREQLLGSGTGRFAEQSAQLFVSTGLGSGHG